jgi:hypothetical protein
MLKAQRAELNSHAPPFCSISFKKSNICYPICFSYGDLSGA